MEWVLHHVPYPLDVTFRFNVGKDVVLMDLHLNEGEDAEVQLKKIIEHEHIPSYMEISLLASLHALIMEDILYCYDASRAGFLPHIFSFISPQPSSSLLILLSYSHRQLPCLLSSIVLCFFLRNTISSFLLLS